jgi:hypothetical protein
VLRELLTVALMRGYAPATARVRTSLTKVSRPPTHPLAHQQCNGQIVLPMLDVNRVADVAWRNWLMDLSGGESTISRFFLPMATALKKGGLP